MTLWVEDFVEVNGVRFCYYRTGTNYHMIHDRYRQNRGVCPNGDMVAHLGRFPSLFVSPGTYHVW